MDTGQLENLGPGGVAVDERHLGLVLADAVEDIGVVLDDDEGEAAAGEAANEAAGGIAVAADHDVTVHLVHFGRLLDFRIVMEGGEDADALGAAEQERDALHEAGTDQDGKPGGEQEGGTEGVRDDALLQRHTRDHEGEFADLSEKHGREDRLPERQAGQAQAEPCYEALAGDEEEEDRQHLAGVVPEHDGVDQHAHRDEEDGGEDVAQRDHVGERGVAELVFGQRQPGKEGAEGDREAEEAAARRQPDREHDRREQGELVRAGVGDAAPDHGQDERAQHVGRRDQRDAGDNGEDDFAGRERFAAEGRDDYHHEDGAELLQDANVDRGDAGDRLELAAAFEDLHDDDGARVGGEEAEDDGDLAAEAEERADEEADRDGEDDLATTAKQGEPAVVEQMAERELDADAEHEQDDADVGGVRDVLEVADGPRRVGANDNAGDEEADNRR